MLGQPSPPSPSCFVLDGENASEVGENAAGVFLEGLNGVVGVSSLSSSGKEFKPNGRVQLNRLFTLLFKRNSWVQRFI